MAVSNSTDRFNGVLASKAFKVRCKVAAESNIDPLSGEQTIESIAVESGDRVLLTAQTDPIENGIWDVSSGAWARAADWDGTRDVAKGSAVFAGVDGADDKLWQLQTEGVIRPGITAVSITEITLGGITVDEYVDGMSFDAGTGDLTLTRVIGTDIVESLEGRYATIAFVNSISLTSLAATPLDNATGLSWEDEGATPVELINFQDQTITGLPVVDPNIGSVTLLATFDNTAVGSETFTPDVGPAFEWRNSNPAWEGLFYEGFITGIQGNPGRSLYWWESSGSPNSNWQTVASTTVGDFGAGDFTIEFDVYCIDLTSSLDVLCKFEFGRRQWFVTIDVAGRMTMNISTNGSSIATPISQHVFPTETFTLNTWHTVRFCRSGSNWYVFLNGELSTQGVQVNGSTIFTPGTSQKLSINADGGEDTGGGANKAYLDNIRITEGVARSTASYDVNAERPFDGGASLESIGIGSPDYRTLLFGDPIVTSGAFEASGTATFNSESIFQGDAVFNATVDLDGVTNFSTRPQINVDGLIFNTFDNGGDNAFIGLNPNAAGKTFRIYDFQNAEDKLLMDLDNNYVYFGPGNTTNGPAIYIGERAAAGPDPGGWGQLWVENVNPQKLWFTDETGIDTDLTAPSESFNPGIADRWFFDSSTVLANPGTNDFRFDNATLGSITYLIINDTAISGNDGGALVANAAIGDQFRIYDPTDYTTLMEFTKVNVAVDQTGWWYVFVDYVSGSLPTNGQEMVIEVVPPQLPIPTVDHSVVRWDSTNKVFLSTGNDLTIDSDTAGLTIIDTNDNSLRLNAVSEIQIPTGVNFLAAFTSNNDTISLGETGGKKYIGTGSSGGDLQIDAGNGSNDIQLRQGSGLMIQEKASAHTNQAGYGQLWVKTATPNELWFSDDAGTDFEVLRSGQPILASNLQDYSIEIDQLGLVTDANQTLNYENGPVFELDLENWTANRTITLSNAPGAGTHGQITAIIRQDGTAARTITWAGGTFRWANGTVKGLNSTLDGFTIFSFETFDAGATWYASGVDYS